jgi:hypothetical protein
MIPVRGETSMRRSSIILATVLFAALFAAAALAPPQAGAWTSHTHHYESHYYGNDYWWHAERMQDDRIAAAEEAAREVQREKRRDEIAQEQEAQQKAYLKSRKAVRDASRAASSAPRGYFYRKPGSTTTALPAGGVEVEAGGKTYTYFSGIFYMQIDPKTFIVVPAPAGAVVDALPEGSQQAFLKGEPSGYSYYFGTFFKEKDGKFEVAEPPAGTVVAYVPDGYQQVEEGDSVRFEFGGLRFTPVMLGQTIVYKFTGSS